MINTKKYSLTFKTLFNNGSIEFTFMIFLSDESQYKVGIGQNLLAEFEKIYLHTSKGLVLGNYSYNKWHN